MQTIYIFSYPLRTLGWWAIILLLDLDYNEIRFRCLSKVLPIRYVPSVQMHRTPHNRRIAKVTVHNWRKLWNETGMSGRNSSNFHAGRETVDTNNKKAMSETPRLRFCNTIYRLRAFSVLLENLWERAIWEYHVRDGRKWIQAKRARSQRFRAKERPQFSQISLFLRDMNGNDGS